MWGPVTLSLVVAALLACGCGGDGDLAGARPDAPSAQRHAGAEAHELPASRAPHLDVPSGRPPERLVVRDLREGSGQAIRRGDEVVVNYVGYVYSTGRRYDTSYGADPAPLEVVPGRGDFIDGFEEGIVGMKVGGRREIVIPPDMGYGARGYSNQVKPNETLVFVVELAELRR